MTARYTHGEELANSITHGIGAFLSMVGLGMLIVHSAVNSSVISLVSSIIYGITLTMMYMSSTLYHSFRKPSIKKLFRTIDHCSIFLLIAGSYTPFTLITLKGTTGYTLFSVIWIITIVGIAINIIDVKKYSKLSLVCYITMGWAVVFAIKPLLSNLDTNGFSFLLWGGIAYTVGILFYVNKKTRYMHSIWHLFVLAGSVLHFIVIFRYVI